ncbi:MAG: hypothetical protein B6240_03955 [Desulfobacteraceae bacterium 4572_87]|nr:MAG: hypothetical protein B6240_03955 [Desulfobacteraceae bacterium 4572_87]
MTSGAIDSLYGIWGSSVSDVFAVGYSGTIFHYDGISWSPMTSGATNSLYGIWGSGSYFFAVGDSGTIFHGASFLYVGSRGNCGTKEPCYSKIQDAIDNAANGFVILVKRGTYEESLNMGSSKTLLIKGGYNEAYDQQAANTTIIQASGPTTIKSSGGSLKFEMINVE